MLPAINKTILNRWRLGTLSLTGILLISLLTGCSLYRALSDAQVSQSKVDRIEVGYSTEQSILSLFGQPYTKTRLGNGWQRWTYFEESKTVYQWPHMRMMQKTLTILFKRGRVIRYRYHKR